MSTNRLIIMLVAIILTTSAAAEQLQFQPLGQPAETMSQAPEWNLSIRRDGAGLPIGSGTAAQGEAIFAVKCAGCHGIGAIGGSAEPLIGEVGSLNSDYPEKTVNSYWPYATTLFDYIRRAMPIDAPFSLNSNEIYALCAYILSQDGIIDPSMELNKATLPQVTMPNRDGFSAVYPQ